LGSGMILAAQGDSLHILSDRLARLGPHELDPVAVELRGLPPAALHHTMDAIAACLGECGYTIVDERIGHSTAYLLARDCSLCAERLAARVPQPYDPTRGY